MQVRLNVGLRLDEYQYSKKLRLNKSWQTVPTKTGNELLRLQYKGRPLVEAQDAEAGNAEVEEAPVESVEGDTEGDS